MSDLAIDEGLIEEIRARMTLRAPNTEAVRSVVAMMSQHFDVEGGSTPYECIVDSATGVGKTYIMAGLIEYLAGMDKPVRNFMILTPGRTIRDKTIRNFTRGDSKSLTGMMRSDLVVVTADNFDSPAIAAAMEDSSKAKVYVFTVQALTSSTGDGRATHEYQEHLGGSLYKFLSELDDLVVLADEHHCYRGPAFSRTIKEMNPEVVIGVTATPDKKDEGLVVYRYPLAKAIEDRLVKAPVLVARQDDRHDDRTKLLDGVTLLKHKERVSEAYAAEQGLTPVRPVMLVIAQSIAEAEAYRDILDSDSFDGGAWIGKTLLVHSDLKADEKEKALAALDAVEDPESSVRVILSVGMLKEGWDVKNVYVIASMRASVSDVLTEQTLGRGMRLPYGEYTDRQMLDTVEVLAHERYEALLRKREALSQQMIDHRILIEIRERADGTKVARTRVVETSNPFEPPETNQPTDESPERPATTPSVDDTETIRDLEDRMHEVRDEADAVPDKPREHKPLPEREPIGLPYVRKVAKVVPVSLNQVLDLSPFQDLGRALTHEAGGTLRRTLLAAKGGKMAAQKAEDDVQALSIDTPLETSRQGLIDRVLKAPGVERRAGEIRRASQIVDAMIEAMGDTAAANLSAYFDRASRRLEAAVAAQLKAHAAEAVAFDDEVVVAPLTKVRVAKRKHLPEHGDVFERSTAYNGWQRHAYEYAWFDSSTEYRAAGAVDKDPNVIVWARLHRGDIPITWTQEGREYNPDFVVIEDVDDKRTCWLVETKMSKEITSREVMGKRKAARIWANTVNSSGQADGEWRYLLLSEEDVNDASGSWAQMKAFGQ